jgi:hypothetical protein
MFPIVRLRGRLSTPAERFSITPMRPSRFPLLVLLLLLTACSAEAEQRRIAALVDPAASVSGFDVCHGSNCAVRTPTGLTEAEWQSIAAIFDDAGGTPGDERRAIALAVARFEALVGPKTNTSSDADRNRSDPDRSTQLDCVDETVNTTTYLRLIEDAGLLRWHGTAAPAHRHFGLVDFHNTAVIAENESGARWAVDSWFAPNGQPPAIVPLEAWIAGWAPGKKLPAAITASSATAP